MYACVCIRITDNFMNEEKPCTLLIIWPSLPQDKFWHVSFVAVLIHPLLKNRS